MNFAQITHSKAAASHFLIVILQFHPLYISQYEIHSLVLHDTERFRWHHEVERVTASKKTKTVTKPKTVIDLGKELPIFSPVSTVNLDNLNLSITTNIKDLLAPLIPQIRDIKDILNLRTKCIDPKPNFNNDVSDITCDKYLVIENKIVSTYR